MSNPPPVSTKAPITAIVLTKNEERAIAECVKSLSFCDQVLVVDSNSEDQTARIAKERGAEVVQFRWNGEYPKKKQWSLECPLVRHDWVLFVDADERPTPELAEELVRLTQGMQAEQSARYAAGEVEIAYHFMGTRLRHGHRVWKRALVNRRKARFPEVDDLGVASMWEVEGHYQPIAQGAVKKLQGTMEHIDPDPLFDYFARHNRYSDWEAHLRVNKNVGTQVRAARSRQGQLFDRLPFKPALFFSYAYIVRGGWRDGRAGLDYAIALATYYWQIELKVRESLLPSHGVAIK